jgi:hypothetical protein
VKQLPKNIPAPPPPEKVTGYLGRRRLLIDLGCGTYDVYLRSALWRTIRSAVLALSPGCALCPKKARVVHHQSYTRENLTGESRKGLHPLCHGCHKSVEFKDGRKLPLADVRTRFTRLWAARQAALVKKARGARNLTPTSRKPRKR